MGETDWGAVREEGEVVDIKGWEAALVEENKRRSFGRSYEGFHLALASNTSF